MSIKPKSNHLIFPPFIATRFQSVDSYCVYAVSRAALHGAFVRRGPPRHYGKDCNSTDCNDIDAGNDHDNDNWPAV